MQDKRITPRPNRLWTGSREPIFDILPGTVLENFKNPRSENALLWNLIYPRAQPSLSMAALLDGPPLWGSSYPEELRGEQLIPYFWGYRHDGVRLEALDEVLEAVDGPGPKTEIDLFLRGSGILIAVEAKHTSSFGRCSRYASGRCPEVHLPLDGDEACRYWEPGPSQFSDLLAFGSRPDPESLAVPCNIHYQLARTLLIGQTLARQLGLAFGLWVIVAQTGWRGLEKTWLAFTECVRDDQQWRMMRVVSWEQIRKLPV